MTSLSSPASRILVAAVVAFAASAALAHDDRSEAGSYHWVTTHAGAAAMPVGSGAAGPLRTESYGHERLERSAADDRAIARTATDEDVVGNAETIGYDRLR